MQRASAIITNKPPEVIIPDYAELRSALSESAASRLGGYVMLVHDLDSRDSISDDELLDTLDSRIGYYVGKFEDNLWFAQRYLARPDPTITSSGWSTGSYGSNHDSPYGAYRKFTEGFRNEGRAVGLDRRLDEWVEAEQLTHDTYDAFADDTRDDLEARFEHFRLMAESFGNTEVMRKEIVQEAVYSVNALVASIGRLGVRPAKLSGFGRAKARMNQDASLQQDGYDRLVDEKLDGFDKRSAFSPESLLRRFIQKAMVHYAKQAFGSTEFRAPIDDPTSRDFMDLFTLQGERKSTRPLLPVERARFATDAALHKLLYGSESRVSQLLDGSGDTHQKQRRAYRESYQYRSEESEPQFKPSDADKNKGRASRQAGKSQQDNLSEILREKLDPAQRAHYVEFDRMQAAIKMTPATRRGAVVVEREFLTRIQKLRGLGEASNASLRKIIKTAMRDYHPDVKNPNPDSSQLYQYYGLLYDFIEQERIRATQQRF